MLSKRDDLEPGLQDRRVIGGRYQVLRVLKSGGGAETLQAIDLTRDAVVVIKTAAATAFSASVRMRIENEAHVLAQTEEGQIASPLDFGFEEDQFYLVMPFIAGITLQERLRQGPLTVTDAITVGRAIFASLRAAHANDVLHRNIKPTNVIVSEGTPLRSATLIDFGLARATNLDSGIREHWVDAVQYISPEGAGLLDQEATTCSDLYSVGIVLFECLAGFPPFHGESVGDVLRQHMAIQPPELRSTGLPVPRASR